MGCMQETTIIRQKSCSNDSRNDLFLSLQEILLRSLMQGKSIFCVNQGWCQKKTTSPQFENMSTPNIFCIMLFPYLVLSSSPYWTHCWFPEKGSGVFWKHSSVKPELPSGGTLHNLHTATTIHTHLPGEPCIVFTSVYFFF